MMNKEVFEAASLTFEMIIYNFITRKKNERIAIRNITNGKEVNAVENVSTYAHIYKLTSC